MINKQIIVLEKIKEIAESVAGIQYAGLYPDAIGNIGQRFPAVVIKDGNEDANRYNTGQTVMYEYNPQILLIHEVNGFNTRIRDILNLQAALITALITDLTLGGTVHNIQGHSIEKGTNQDILTEMAAGYQGEITVNTITLNTIIMDTRS